MCGICGIIPSSKEAIKRMNTSMAHRGPDGEGYYEDDNISLGHSRLAIIDLETGDQPIFNENRDICIVFNGEIYNYKELRRELKSRHRFYTDSDTEVIVHLYEELGSKCLNRLNGMFA
ncbi:asparagine synthetase B, partial [candidate division WOR-3 bacterium]|nr:asparagine synthetase B [candidate division WOR-3 bacterium]